MWSRFQASPSGRALDEESCKQRHILVPLLKQKIKFPSWAADKSWMGILDLVIVCRYTFDAFDRLYTPPNQVADFIWQARRSSSARQSPLERLPPEILREILSALHITDQIAVALCSEYLWVHAVSAIRKHLRSNHKHLSWAGTPIASLPWWPIYLPQALLDAVPEANRPVVGRRVTRFWLRDWVKAAISSYEMAASPDHHALIREFWKHIPSSGIPDDLHPRMESCLSIHTRKSGGSCYLRNLTVKEYIRLELTKKGASTTATVVGHSWLTLDMLVIWLISLQRGPPRQVPDWGNEPEMEGWASEFRADQEVYPETQNIGRRFGLIAFTVLGNWAGHCLDVVDEASEEMIVHWHDRTLDVEKRARSWLMAIYIMSLELTRFPEMRKHWEYWHQVVKEEIERGDGPSGSS